jgi:hypothetical protein
MAPKLALNDAERKLHRRSIQLRANIKRGTSGTKKHETTVPILKSKIAVDGTQQFELGKA